MNRNESRIEPEISSVSAQSGSATIATQGEEHPTEGHRTVRTTPIWKHYLCLFSLSPCRQVIHTLMTAMTDIALYIPTEGS